VAATVANASPVPSVTSSALALEEQVQQLSFQGLSVNQIAANLNISVSEAQLYLTGPQTAGTNNAAATTSANPKIKLY
jgi:orotate phosphoribosyltransferase-like protein